MNIFLKILLISLLFMSISCSKDISVNNNQISTNGIGNGGSAGGESGVGGR